MNLTNSGFKLNPIKANMTELRIGHDVILFSYKTPVALQRFNLESGLLEHYCTHKRWSNTTTRHINKWLAGLEAIEMPQEFFDNLIADTCPKDCIAKGSKHDHSYEVK